MTNEELIAEARRLEGDYSDSHEVVTHMSVLADALEAASRERDAALAVIERIREAVSGHPECDRYEEGDVISCGWKSAYASVVAALDGAPEPENDDPCNAEVYSWDHYRPEQIDSYWIRCTLLGKHDEHEDSHTGLKWRSGLPVEGESDGV